jgi:sulfatase modifying factor 1
MRTLFYCLLILFFFSACNQKNVKESSRSTRTIEPEFVLIPGGSFIMGCESSGDVTFIDDYPHQVYVDSFYMDKYEVTNSQYFEFCQATGHNYPEFWNMNVYNSGPDYPDFPVTGVAWADARAYAEWRGLRLPTEAEWEYAARGGLIGKKFPSGDDMDSTMANYYPTQGHTLPVGSYAPNGYGLYDMAGNVVEWVTDFYSKDYYLESPYENPAGPVYGKRRVIRGGGWRSGKSCNSVHFRQSLRPYWVDFNVGFRCAKDLEE